jgi:PAS domain S-box-containing protein
MDTNPNSWFWQQSDYLLFILLALALLGVSATVLPRLRPGARLWWPVWVLFPVVLAAGWWFTQQAGDAARMNDEAQVSALAPTYAYELEQMGHFKLASDCATNDPRYLAMIDAEIQWEKLNPYAHDIYTMRKRADGTNIFIVDSETDYDHNGKFEGEREQRTPIGKVYDEADPGLEKAFQGETNFDEEVITDEWGTWVSAFVPLHAPDGKVEGVLGVDFDAGVWLKDIAADRHAAETLVALLLAIILGSGVIIALLRADIAYRIIAEERARHAEQRMQLIIRQMPLAFIEWSIEGKAMAWNPAAEKIFGHAAGEMVGQADFSRIVPQSVHEHVNQVWANLLNHAGDTHSINENLTKDGRVITCEWFNTPLVDVNGQVVGVISLCQDVTERLSLEKQLQRSERLKAIGQIAAGVAHDFNNILTVITGHAGMLLANPGLPDAYRNDLSRIESAAMNAAVLTRQLLAFSSRQMMFPKPLQLAPVVENVVALLARPLGAGIKLDLRMAGAVPPVEADSAMIEQVITNLVLNARDALPHGGQITVSLDVVSISQETAALNPDARPGTMVCLSVSDTGTGITSEQQARIFEPFFTTKPKGRGTGLGLSVVHGVVRQHKGWITVSSQPDKGSTFSVFFPPTEKAVEAAAEKPAVLLPAETAPVGRTILVAEDEEGVRALAILTLERAGYRVVAAPDGPTALKLWHEQKGRFDLLFTDMVMPNGMTGRELSLRILAERPNLPVIYASGYSLELTAPSFRESDRMTFLPKPYLTQQLIDAVRRCLGQAG